MGDLAETDLRKRLAQGCRVLASLGLAKGCTGHLSVRMPGSPNVLIRARGPKESGVQFTTDEDIIEVTPAGSSAHSGCEERSVPQEVFIHTAVYAARPDVNSVVHVHPATIVLFTITGVPLLPIFGAYDPSGLRLLMDGVPTYDRSALIATEALGRDLAATLGEKHACMMRGHGIVTTGASIEEAALRAISLNELAEMNFRARQLGQPQPISTEDIESFAARASAEVGKGIERASSSAALWRYYLRLTGS